MGASVVSDCVAALSEMFGPIALVTLIHVATPAWGAKMTSLKWVGILAIHFCAPEEGMQISCKAALAECISTLKSSREPTDKRAERFGGRLLLSASDR